MNAPVTVLHLPDRTVDLLWGRVHLGQEQVRLTDRERTALLVLCAAEEPVAWDALAEEAWEEPVSRGAVEMLIGRLRKKIEVDPSDPQVLRTVHGRGYAVVVPEAAPEVWHALPPLPAQRIPRPDLLAELTRWPARLVTLTGPGGVGKTHLALAHAWNLRATGQDVVVCDLAACRTLDDVVRTVADRVHPEVRGGSAVGVAKQLGAAMVGQDRVLVLDNCEQAVDAVAEAVALWLAAVPELRVVATSRIGLQVAGEHLVQVTTLDPDQSRTLLRYRLEEAASEPPPAELVEPLVAWLDGLPLAIELAASGLAATHADRVLEVVEALVMSLRRADGGRANRQTCLEETLRWSWDLLDPYARTVLAGCGVFSGPIDVDDAEAVVDPGRSLLDTLGLLVRHSWLVPVEGHRVKLLVPIRAWARERLHEQDPRGQVRARHTAHFVERARAAWRDPGDQGLRRAPARLHRHLEDLHRAFEHACARSDAESAAVVALGIDAVLGRHVCRRLRCDRYAEALELEPPPVLRAALRAAQARAWVLDGRTDDARQAVEEALAATGDGDPQVRVEALLAAVESGVGAVDTLREQAISLAREHGLRALQVELLLSSSAPGRVDEALRLARETGHAEQEVRCRLARARALADAGQDWTAVAEELEAARRCVAVADELPSTSASLFQTAAELAWRGGRMDEALAGLKQASHSLREGGRLFGALRVEGAEAFLRALAGQAADVLHELETDTTAAKAQQDTVRWAVTAPWLAAVAALQGEQRVVDATWQDLAETVPEAWRSGPLAPEDALTSVAHVVVPLHEPAGPCDWSVPDGVVGLHRLAIDRLMPRASA